MRGFVKQCQRTVRRTGIGAFLELPRIDDSDGHTLFRPRDGYKIGGSDQDRIPALTDGIHRLGEIFHDGNLLLAQRSDKICTQIRMKVKKSKSRLARSGSARIVKDQPSLPFGIEKVFVRPKLLGVYELGIEKTSAALERGHRQKSLVRIEKFHPAAPGFWIFHIGHHESGFERIECAHGNHRFESSRGSVNEDIPETAAGFALRRDAGWNFAAQDAKQVHRYAIFFLKGDRERIAYRRSHIRDHGHLAFLPSGIERLVPIVLPVRARTQWNGGLDQDYYYGKSCFE